MNMLTISCPNCGFSREIPADRVPEGERRVTCPQCKSGFQFRKPGPAAPKAQEPPALSSPQSEPQEPVAPSPPPCEPQEQPQPQWPQQPQPAAQPESATRPQSAAKPQPQFSSRPQTGSRASAARAFAPGMHPGAKPGRGELSDISDLFQEAWQLFQRRFSTLIGLFLLSVAGFLAPAALAAVLAPLLLMAAGKIAVAALGILAGAGSVYAGLRCFSAFLQAVVDDRLGLKDALTRGRDKIWSLLWVGLLSGFIISGGFMLLVVPGIIFTVWFCFAQFILVAEGTTGMDALLKSREYVREQWFNVALRLLLVWAVSVLIGAIPVAGVILTIVFLPYVTIFHYLIYRELRAVKGEVVYGCGLSDRAKWPVLALLGYLVLPVVLVSVLGVSLLGHFGLPGSKQRATLSSIAVSQPQAESGPEGYRVITFPGKTDPAPEAPAAAQPGVPAAPALPVEPQGAQSEEPTDLSIFIYAVNYTGTVKANGSVIRELEGKPDMQYNYNMDGRSLRYGANQIEVEFAEVPSHQQSLLGVHMKVSRHRPGSQREVLGEWRFEDKGSGTHTFTLEIPK